MSNDLLTATALLWIAGSIIALTGRVLWVARAALGLGGIAAVLAATIALPGGTSGVELPFPWAGKPIGFRMEPGALWLMGFGLVPAILSCILATPARQGRAGWLFGTAISLLGALGVFGVQNAAAFLIAWELMSLGGAVMLLSEHLTTSPGAPVLFMLGLLEVGAVALLLAILLLTQHRSSLSFDSLVPAAVSLPVMISMPPTAPDLCDASKSAARVRRAG